MPFVARSLQAHYHRGGGPHASALSGVETATWDALGRTLGTAVATLLGGRDRDRVTAYAPTGYATADWDFGLFRDMLHRHVGDLAGAEITSTACKGWPTPRARWPPARRGSSWTGLTTAQGTAAHRQLVTYLHPPVGPVLAAHALSCRGGVRASILSRIRWRPPREQPLAAFSPDGLLAAGPGGTEL